MFDVQLYELADGSEAVHIYGQTDLDAIYRRGGTTIFGGKGQGETLFEAIDNARANATQYAAEVAERAATIQARREAGFITDLKVRSFNTRTGWHAYVAIRFPDGSVRAVWREGDGPDFAGYRTAEPGEQRREVAGVNERPTTRQEWEYYAAILDGKPV